MPVCVNVYVKDCPGDKGPEFQVPSGVAAVPLVVVWIAAPLLVHLILSPTLTLLTD